MDFPQPFGPIMPVTPSSKFTIVLSAKLLNPFISKLFSRTVLTIFTMDKSNGSRLKVSTGLNLVLVNCSLFVHKHQALIR